MLPSYPELYVEQKQADIRREIEHSRLLNEAKKANSPPHGRKTQTNPFHVSLIKRIAQVAVSFLAKF
jgi:hypothetical protein